MKTHTQPKMRGVSDFIFCNALGCKAQAEVGSDYCGRHRKRTAAAPEAPQGIPVSSYNSKAMTELAESIIAENERKEAPQHSPLPWRSSPPKGERPACVHSSEGDCVAVCSGIVAPNGANADYIVEACNNYANAQADRDNAKAELERAKAECDKAWATSNRHLIERNQRIEQVRELLAALKDIAADAETANDKRNTGEWDFRCTHIEAAAKAAITKAEQP